MKCIESIDARRRDSQCVSQLQSETQSVSNEAFDLNFGFPRKKTSQAVLYSYSIAAEFKRVIAARKRRASEARAHHDLARLTKLPVTMRQ